MICLTLFCDFIFINFIESNKFFIIKGLLSYYKIKNNEKKSLENLFFIGYFILIGRMTLQI